MDRNELLSAIRARHSVRRYLDQPIPAKVRAELDEEVRRCNAESGLSMQILYDEPQSFSGRMAHYGSFRNVHNYIALVGRTGTSLDLACGYYGQRVVLLAQHLGLSTCWVGLTYSKRKATVEVGEDEKLALVISLGYGEPGSKPHKRRKPIEKLGRVRGGGPMPTWFCEALQIVALAPSAIHQQKYRFELDGSRVHATGGFGSFVRVDLGIAKFHFEVGAGDHDFTWG
jgi:hypothetical protein